MESTSLNYFIILKRIHWLRFFFFLTGADEVVVDYVFNELEQYYAFCIDGDIEMATVDGVYQADKLIPEDLKAAFIEQVAVLENVSDEDKDWHPGSSNQVLDLVHPSLHCYVSGVTKVTRKQLPCDCKFPSN